MDKGASPDGDRATRASTEPVSRLGHTASVPCAFTPGPWNVEREEDDSNFWHSIYSEGFKGLLVARCDQNGKHAADAHLIAAAPELYDALEALAREAHDISSDTWEMVETALAKARGQ